MFLSDRKFTKNILLYNNKLSFFSQIVPGRLPAGLSFKVKWRQLSMNLHNR